MIAFVTPAKRPAGALAADLQAVTALPSVAVTTLCTPHYLRGVDYIIPFGVGVLAGY